MLFVRRESTLAILNDPLDDMYRDVVLDHYRNPRGRGKLEHCHAKNEGLNPLCGDDITLCLSMDGNQVNGVQISSRGCSISTASGSMMAELLPGKTPDQIREIINIFKGMMHGEAPPEGVDIGDLDALQGVQKFPVRVKCAMLPWTTLEDALRAWEAGNSSAPAPSSTENPESKTQ